MLVLLSFLVTHLTLESIQSKTQILIHWNQFMSLVVKFNSIHFEHSGLEHRFL